MAHGYLTNNPKWVLSKSDCNFYFFFLLLKGFPMKKLITKLLENTLFFIISNVVIGCTVLITIIGFIVGIAYLMEKSGQFLGMLHPAIIGTVTIGITVAVAFVLLFKLGNGVREKITDELIAIRWRREQERLSQQQNTKIVAGVSESA